MQEFLVKNGPAKANEISDILELSGSRTRAILFEMIEEGTVKIDGEGRSRRYMALN